MNLIEANLEIGRLRTALETVLNYSNDPAIIKMVEYALAQTPVSFPPADRQVTKNMESSQS
jgi:hypothetical protein